MGRISFPASSGGATYLVASDNVKDSANTERYITATDPVKVKEFRVLLNGSIRVKQELKRGMYAADATSNIYVNGILYGGTTHTTNSTSYVPYSDDILVHGGDLVQIYLKASTANTVFIKNATIGYDITDILDPSAVLVD